MSGSGAMLSVPVSQADGILSITGLPLHTPAYAILDLTPLWMGPDIRGEDLLIPGRTGVLPLPRRATVTTKSLPMIIDGRYDRLGNRWDNEREGLRRNIALLRTYFTDPTYSGDGTRWLTLTSPTNIVTLSGPVHVTGIEVGREYGPIWRASLNLSLPLGTL